MKILSFVRSELAILLVGPLEPLQFIRKHLDAVNRSGADTLALAGPSEKLSQPDLVAIHDRRADTDRHFVTGQCILLELGNEEVEVADHFIGKGLVGCRLTQPEVGPVQQLSVHRQQIPAVSSVILSSTRDC